MRLIKIRSLQHPEFESTFKFVVDPLQHTLFALNTNDPRVHVFQYQKSDVVSQLATISVPMVRGVANEALNNIKISKAGIVVGTNLQNYYFYQWGNFEQPRLRINGVQLGVGPAFIWADKDSDVVIISKGDCYEFYRFNTFVTRKIATIECPPVRVQTDFEACMYANELICRYKSYSIMTQFKTDLQEHYCKLTTLGSLRECEPQMIFNTDATFKKMLYENFGSTHYYLANNDLVFYKQVPSDKIEMAAIDFHASHGAKIVSAFQYSRSRQQGIIHN